MELAEMQALERVLELGQQHLQVQCLRRVDDGTGQTYPLYGIALGSTDPEAPAAGYFGGVHGLERIGAEVVISFLHTIVMRLQWDSSLHRQLEHVRLLFMPIVNPGGMALGTRANPRGVDLMRNAPVQAVADVPWLLGGQLRSPYLPWYRGEPGAPMEAENQVLCEWVAREMLSRPFSVALDCHSGFGMRDRIWFPFAHTRQPMAHLAEMVALRNVFFQTYSHHQYIFEPQSLQYLTHGDVWDYLYLQALERAVVFLPLTLEMGSWLWIKKNPRQLFSRHGIFNPLIAHRQQRVLRRHQSLLDFVGRAAAGQALWRPSPQARAALHDEALAQWY
ncbi:M14 family zinc carboxypeptidase [Curvibacter sp. APW13]|uniref:M14 family zinc carboxypeptidase n=1 Tax=Curvibacter sp. APW13 TaxID=3077236 RepID=UPI0028DE8A22|nr:M14 family zinc carboxypeptidase [Curvibacter sp. APW13]MDT8992195.1 M14 family zinc carboxypeptidase [Curvibacter sp. APW13]